MAHVDGGYGVMKTPSADPHLLASLRRIGAKPPEIIELLDYVENLLVWVKDAEGHYQWVNMAFLLNFGVASRADIIGCTDFDFCGPVMANQYQASFIFIKRFNEQVNRMDVEVIGRFIQH